VLAASHCAARRAEALHQPRAGLSASNLIAIHRKLRDSRHPTCAIRGSARGARWSCACWSSVFPPIFRWLARNNFVHRVHEQQRLRARWRRVDLAVIVDRLHAPRTLQLSRQDFVLQHVAPAGVAA
jgi:hypothetical protein